MANLSRNLFLLSIILVAGILLGAEVVYGEPGATGFCIVRDVRVRTIIPALSEPDAGQGYVRSLKPGISYFDERLDEACEQSFEQLVRSFCKENPGPVWQELGLYLEDGGITSACGAGVFNATTGCAVTSCASLNVTYPIEELGG